MPILSAATIQRLGIVSPCIPSRPLHGLSGGLSRAGYDIHVHLHRPMTVWPFCPRLAVSVERFSVPADVMGFVTSKSTLARRFLDMPATTLEPGWQGYLTLELVNHSLVPIRLQPGQPICQVIFLRLDEPAEPYDGRYQHQPQVPVAPILSG